MVFVVQNLVISGFQVLVESVLATVIEELRDSWISVFVVASVAIFGALDSRVSVFNWFRNRFSN